MDRLSKPANIFIFGPVIYIVRINCLSGIRGRERVERVESREDMDYNTHLARILSAGQGLCNTSCVQHSVSAHQESINQ